MAPPAIEGTLVSDPGHEKLVLPAWCPQAPRPVHFTWGQCMPVTAREPLPALQEILPPASSSAQAPLHPTLPWLRDWAGQGPP